ncbi:hypothetical protein AB1Y20_022423 [Prymnesium parvum]|uniref:HU family DNA-binding protein n=1 Tax=Prymnesium parvum TaxID=97485 RepID=A0AB34JIY6_PRYPA|mmetsp:Transcript_5461/g.13957  ORF Transcript_5461/g.13957 Transcript_5461/m.13957 type:complete len:147 (+) Transcript_5461:27-467(+)|eukprot:CAMPEP_0182820976 /NCGR_PEP_ID=MMETSP0006_2-20121128/13416_1 /TAXON_ID=97485 /ORGANISM="Prymnesium parvum, Strain Texoma1" /LENGTH=146 /DNA_ID=CAMNT_0024947687 /DNA_START=23 /DNA_END=463 /DNA_ORIENTATION=-
MAMRPLALLLCCLRASEALQLSPAVPLRHTPIRRGPAPVLVQMTVSKQEMVDAIALKAGVSKKTAAIVLASTLDVIVESVASGNKVSLIGFGTFDSKDRPEREGRNPKTGEKMLLKASVVPTFSFGKSFKDAVKEAGASRMGKESK